LIQQTTKVVIWSQISDFNLEDKDLAEEGLMP